MSSLATTNPIKPSVWPELSRSKSLRESPRKNIQRTTRFKSGKTESQSGCLKSGTKNGAHKIKSHKKALMPSLYNTLNQSMWSISQIKISFVSLKAMLPCLTNNAVAVAELAEFSYSYAKLFTIYKGQFEPIPIVAWVCLNMSIYSLYQWKTLQLMDTISPRRPLLVRSWPKFVYLRLKSHISCDRDRLCHTRTSKMHGWWGKYHRFYCSGQIQNRF